MPSLALTFIYFKLTVCTVCCGLFVSMQMHCYCVLRHSSSHRLCTVLETPCLALPLLEPGELHASCIILPDMVTHDMPSNVRRMALKFAGVSTLWMGAGWNYYLNLAESECDPPLHHTHC